jgi:hypothetical protein
MGRLLDHGHQLLTSRCRTGWPEGTHLVSLDVLDHDEAVRLLCATGGRTAESGAALLAQDLGHLPLALTQAGAYVRETGIRFAAYRAKLARVPDAVLTDGTGRSDRTIAQIWRTSLESIRPAHPLAVPLLHTLAWYAPETVPREVLHHLGHPSDAVDRSLEALAAYHLITPGYDGPILHRLVQQTLRHADPAEVPKARDLAERALAAELSGTTPESVRRSLQHIQALAATGPAAEPDPAAVEMYRRGTEELVAREQHVLAIPLMTLAVDGSTRLLGTDDETTLDDRDRLAELHAKAGDPARAVSLCHDVYLDRVQLCGPDAVQTLAARERLAYAHRKAGEAIRAVAELTAVVADRRRVQGDEHPDTLTSRNNLAYALQMAGRHEAAVEEFEAVVADRERLLGPRHEDTLASRSNLAYAHRWADDHATALRLYEQAVADRRSVHGPDHPDTLTSRGWLASACQGAGDPGRAVTLYQEVVADRTRVQGAEHPDTLRSRQDLAWALSEARGPEAALHELEALAADSARAQGPDHPSTPAPSPSTKR